MNELKLLQEGLKEFKKIMKGRDTSVSRIQWSESNGDGTGMVEVKYFDVDNDKMCKINIKIEKKEGN